MDQALDIRAILRMQSLLLTIVRVFFDRKHMKSLSLQKLGRSIETQQDEGNSLLEQLIYGCPDE